MEINLAKSIKPYLEWSGGYYNSFNLPNAMAKLAKEGRVSFINRGQVIAIIEDHDQEAFEIISEVNLWAGCPIRPDRNISFEEFVIERRRATNHGELINATVRERLWKKYDSGEEISDIAKKLMGIDFL